MGRRRHSVGSDLMASWPTLAEIFEARQRIASLAIETPLVASALPGKNRAPLWLKLETLQPIGAFKLRGAANALACMAAEQRARGVVCCSTGNHGRAVAYAARAMGIPATVCLSELVPEVKVTAIEALGAQVLRVGRSQDEAQIRADDLVARAGLVDIPPFDHFDVIAGQGTIGVELLQERPELEVLLVPLSGGGLISGIAIAAKAIKPSIHIIGISMDRGAAMAASLEAGAPCEVIEMPSLADSLGGGIGQENAFTLDICRELVDEVVLVSEAEIYRGLRELFFSERLVAEGGSAVSHAAISAGKIEIDRPTAAIISGRNIDMVQFAHVIAGEAVQLGELTVGGGDQQPAAGLDGQ